MGFKWGNRKKGVIQGTFGRFGGLEMPGKWMIGGNVLGGSYWAGAGLVHIRNNNVWEISGEGEQSGAVRFQTTVGSVCWKDQLSVCAYPELAQEHSESEIMAIKQEIQCWVMRGTDWGCLGNTMIQWNSLTQEGKWCLPLGSLWNQTGGWPEEP